MKVLGKELKRWVNSERVLALFGALVPLLGGVILWRWHAHGTLLLKGGASILPPSYNTGIGLVLCGLGLLWAAARWEIASRVVGAILAVLGALSLLELFLNSSLFVNEVFYRLTASSGYSPRMAVSSALCFFLVGLGFGLIPRRHDSCVLCWSVLGSIVLTIGFVASLGHLVNVPQLYLWAGAAPMTVSVALGTIVMGAGLLVLAWREDQNGSARARRWLPVPVGLGMLTATLVVWWAVDGQEQRRLEESIAAQAVKLRESIIERVGDQLVPVVRMASRWRDYGRPGFGYWKADAKVIMRHFPAYDAMAWIDSGFQTRWVVHKDSAFVDQPLNAALTRPVRIELSRLYSEHHDFKIMRRKDLAEPGDTFHAYVPVYSGKESDGFILAILKIRELISTTLLDNPLPGYSFVIKQGSDSIYERIAERSEVRRSVEVRFDLYGIRCEMTVWPTEETLLANRTLLSSAILAIGIILSLLVSFLIQLVRAVSHRAREAELTNEYLAAADEHLQRQAVDLMAAREDALRASRYKSDFLASMSHEIRTPLTAVIGVVDLLERTRLSKEQSGYVQTAKSASHTLLSLISDILDFSRIEAGKLTLEERDFDMAELVSQVKEMVGFLAQQKGIAFTSTVTRNTPRMVRGDPDRLRQVIINIVGNAIKYTEKGSVNVKVGLQEEQASLMVLRFEVADTGIGISAEAQPHIFDSFDRGDRDSSLSRPGAGLGLAISQRLVQLMGGSIWLKSEVGKGSTFWFTVSLKKASAEARPVRATSENKSRCRGKLRILLAEDNRMNQMVLSKFLGKLGHDVVVASNGEETLTEFKEGGFDLVFMDCRMPVMNGYQAARRIRNEEKSNKLPTIPVIALTAHAVEGERDKCLRHGMDDCLVKPVTLAALENAIEKWRPSTRIRKTKSVKHRSAKTADTPKNYPLDRSIIFSLFLLQDDDPGFFEQLVDTFRSEVPESIERIRQFISKGDNESVANEAHSLKSSCGHLGAKGMATLCRRMEEFAEKGKLKNCPKLLDNLASDFVTVVEALENEMGQAKNRKAA